MENLTKESKKTKAQEKKEFIDKLWKESKSGDYIPIEKILARSL